jgi:hypothetical protein
VATDPLPRSHRRRGLRDSALALDDEGADVVWVRRDFVPGANVPETVAVKDLNPRGRLVGPSDTPRPAVL